MPTAVLPLFFVVDAAAGGASYLGSLSARLQAGARAHALIEVRQASERQAAIGRAVNAAREARGAVVAVGDQRTVNAVLQAAWNAQLPMGVMPTGDPAMALETLLGARPQPLPLGCVGDRVFMRGAELGLRLTLPAPDPGAAATGDPAALALDFAALLAGRSLLTLRLQCQGVLRVVRTRGLRVGPPKAPSEAAPPLLRVQARPAVSAAATAALLLRAAWAGAQQRAEADGFEAEQLQLDGSRRRHQLTVQLDGETIELPLPLTFQVAPRPLPWLGAA